jgi:hypothetical protein
MPDERRLTTFHPITGKDGGRLLLALMDLEWKAAGKEAAEILASVKAELKR